MQAGGRRFDPVILHQFIVFILIVVEEIHSKPKLPWPMLSEAILVLIGIYQLTTSRKTHGCSLKIHRVELDVIKGNCTFVKV